MSGSVAGGEYNVAIGNYTLDALTSGDYNTVLGYNAGGALTTGTRNVIIGSNTGDVMTTGSSNVIIGDEAVGGGDFTGSSAVIIGRNAGHDLTSGTENTIVGMESGKDLTVGSYNATLGHEALAAAQGDRRNVAIGFESLKVFNTGTSVNDTENTAVGYQAGLAVSSGASNCLVGSRAGDTIQTGGSNTIIGTGADAYLAAAEHQIVLGNGLLSVGDNNVTLGKGTGSDRVYNQYISNATWTRVSDQRYKKDITDNTDCGLDFINDLRPVTFKWKAKSEIDTDLPDYDASKTDSEYSEKMYGLIAQEVKETMDKHNITNFGGWDEKQGIQSIAQSMFVYPLIKAVQELSAKVKALEEA
jgi:hypothetical protein